MLPRPHDNGVKETANLPSRVQYPYNNARKGARHMTVTLSPLQIDCAFDSGNIQVLDASNPAQVHLPSARTPTAATISGFTSRSAG